jgi:hypothetical protein
MPITLLAYFVFVIYGMFLERKLDNFRRVQHLPAKPERWNPEHYSADAEPWLRRDRLYERSRFWVSLGPFVLANAAYLLLRP